MSSHQVSSGRESLGAFSEVGKLRTVLVHRPDLSLERLTPANRSDFLFDDVVWLERAQREHDAFCDALRDRGVEVLYLAELLAETLDHSDEARRNIVRARGVVVHGRPLDGGRAAGVPVRPRARQARRGPDRRADHLRTRRHRSRRSQSPLVGRGPRRGELVRPAAAAQHDVHPRLQRVALRRRRAAALVLARTAARGLERLRDLSPPSALRGRGLPSSGIRRQATPSDSRSRTSARAHPSRAAT